MESVSLNNVQCCCCKTVQPDAVGFVIKKARQRCAPSDNDNAHSVTLQCALTPADSLRAMMFMMFRDIEVQEHCQASC